jgi:hypothetical protein
MGVVVCVLSCPHAVAFVGRKGGVQTLVESLIFVRSNSCGSEVQLEKQGVVVRCAGGARLFTALHPCCGVAPQYSTCGRIKAPTDIIKAGSLQAA